MFDLLRDDSVISGLLFAQDHYMEHQAMGHGPHWVVDAVIPCVAMVSVFTMIVLVVVIPTIVHHRHKTRLAELNTTLKQQMIDCAYSPEEILAVVSENAQLLNGRAGKMSPSRTPLERLPV